MFPPSEMKRRVAPQFGNRAARDVARPEHEVGALLGGGDQLGNRGRVVGEVAVHLEHELGAVGERAPEAGDVGGTEPFLARPVEDADERKLCGELVGELAGAVG